MSVLSATEFKDYSTSAKTGMLTSCGDHALPPVLPRTRLVRCAFSLSCGGSQRSILVRESEACLWCLGTNRCHKTNDILHKMGKIQEELVAWWACGWCVCCFYRLQHQ